MSCRGVGVALTPFPHACHAPASCVFWWRLCWCWVLVPLLPPRLLLPVCTTAASFVVSCSKCHCLCYRCCCCGSGGGGGGGFVAVTRASMHPSRVDVTTAVTACSCEDCEHGMFRGNPGTVKCPRLNCHRHFTQRSLSRKSLEEQEYENEIAIRAELSKMYARARDASASVVECVTVAAPSCCASGRADSPRAACELARKMRRPTSRRSGSGTTTWRWSSDMVFLRTAPLWRALRCLCLCSRGRTLSWLSVYNLVTGVDVETTREKISAYQRENAHKIRQQLTTKVRVSVSSSWLRVVR